MSGVVRFAATLFLAIDSYFRYGGEPENSLSSTQSPSHLVTGIILARGGSKGIPHKNLALLNGHPLIHWALEAMLQSGVFHSVWVSTDDPAIREYVTNNKPGVRVHDRAEYTATDEATSISALQEFINSHPEIQTNIFCLVQATSPFIQPKYLIEGYNLMKSDLYDSVFSVTRQFKLRWSDITSGDKNTHTTTKRFTKALNFNPFSRPRRQDWPGELAENGMFYFTQKDLLIRGAFQGERSNYVEIPKEHSLEIDTKEDLIFANILFNQEMDKMSEEMERVKYFLESESYKEEL